jgi:hypothetical protein
MSGADIEAPATSMFSRDGRKKFLIDIFSDEIGQRLGIACRFIE